VVSLGVADNLQKGSWYECEVCNSPLTLTSEHTFTEQEKMNSSLLFVAKDKEQFVLYYEAEYSDFPSSRICFTEDDRRNLVRSLYRPGDLDGRDDTMATLAERMLKAQTAGGL
jgi:hypothetical protein